MTLTELREAVYAITNRPDLVAQTFLMIQRATLQAHTRDLFYRDLFETGITFTTSEYQQQFEYKTLIPKWRQLKYIRKFDATATPAPGVPGAFFEILDPSNVLDGYSIHRENVGYIAGSLFQLRSNTEFQYALLGCYTFPDITADTYSSWIATDYPFAIVFEAAALIFKAIGKMDEFASHRDLVNTELQLLVNSNILVQGD